FMVRLIGRKDHHLPDDFAIQIDGKVLFKAIEGFCTAFAAVAYVFILDRDAPVRRDVLLEPSSTRSAPRVWLGILCENLRDGLHDLLQRRLLGGPGLLLLQPALPPGHLPPHHGPGAVPRPRPPLPPPHSRSCAALSLLGPTNVTPASATTASADVRSAWAARPTALRSAWPSRFKVSSTRPAPNSGVESRAARSGRAPNPPVFSAKATVQSSRVLSKSCAMSRIRKLNRVP